MKKCIDCDTNKKLEEFYNGANQCKICLLAKRRTYEGVAKQIYREQKHSCKKRPKAMPTYTENQFIEWFKMQPNSKDVYNNWVDNDYDKQLRPSADRLNPNKSYTLSNLELVTWKENCSRGYRDVRNGVISRQHIKVFQYTPKGELMAEFKSIKLASKAVGLHIMSVHQAVDELKKDGTPRLSGGYVWKTK